MRVSMSGGISKRSSSPSQTRVSLRWVSRISRYHYSVQESPITLHEEARLSERLNPDSGKLSYVDQLEINGDFIHAVYDDEQYMLRN
jgi:hypothetical protein